jgi:hypothetical protein
MIGVNQRAYAYKKIRVNGILVFEHRNIAEKNLGKKLSSEELVHHINGNKSDNRIENLRIVTRQTHGSHKDIRLAEIRKV